MHRLTTPHPTKKLFARMVIAVLPLVALFAVDAPANAGPPVRETSQLWTPLNGTVFDQATSENVSIQSNLHVVVQTAPNSRTVHVNVADATASGLASGQPYSFTGAASGEADVEALVFVVMMEAAKSARDDLKSIMNAIELINCPFLPCKPTTGSIVLRLTFSESGALTGARATFGQTD